jgi:hypothetical protein
MQRLEPGHIFSSSSLPTYWIPPAGVPVGPDVVAALGLAAGVLVGFGVGWFAARARFLVRIHDARGKLQQLESVTYVDPTPSKKPAKWIKRGRP